MGNKDIFEDMDSLLDGPEEKVSVGRPTDFRPEYVEQTLKLCLLGATDKVLAEFFGVCEATVNNWKLVQPEFLESLKNGKLRSDMEVASSLFGRARTMTYITEKAIKVKTGKDQEKVEIVEVKETIPPDPASMFFWLKNRQPELWRDKQDLDLTSKGEALNTLASLDTEDLIKRAAAVSKLAKDE